MFTLKLLNLSFVLGKLVPCVSFLSRGWSESGSLQPAKEQGTFVSVACCLIQGQKGVERGLGEPTI